MLANPSRAALSSRTTAKSVSRAHPRSSFSSALITCCESISCPLSALSFTTTVESTCCLIFICASLLENGHNGCHCLILLRFSFLSIFSAFSSFLLFLLASPSNPDVAIIFCNRNINRLHLVFSCDRYSNIL